MSVPPTRPRFTPGEQRGQQRNGRAAGGRVLLNFIGKTLWLGAVVCGFYYLMNQLKQPTGTVIVPNAQAPPPKVGQAAPVPSLSPSPAPPPVPVNLENVELVTAASVQRQQLAAGKFKQRQTLATFAEVKRAQDEWEKELAAWDRTGPPLLKSDDGKKIATDAALVKRFRVLIDLDRPTREALADARRQAEDLISPVREAELNPEDASAPAEDLTKNLRELQTQARKARDSYRDGRGAIEGLIAQAGAAGEKTLEQATAAQAHDDALARAAIIEAEIKKAEEEGTRLVAEENAKLIRVKSELEAGRIRDQAEQKRQGLLQTGSVWKGTLVVGDVKAPSTITIGRREKDVIEGTVSWNNQGRRDTVAFAGTVQGTVIKFKVTKVVEGVASLGVTYNAIFDAVQRTITGTYARDGQVTGTYGYRLSVVEE